MNYGILFKLNEKNYLPRCKLIQLDNMNNNNILTFQLIRDIDFSLICKNNDKLEITLFKYNNDDITYYSIYEYILHHNTLPPNITVLSFFIHTVLLDMSLRNYYTIIDTNVNISLSLYHIDQSLFLSTPIIRYNTQLLTL